MKKILQYATLIITIFSLVFVVQKFINLNLSIHFKSIEFHVTLLSIVGLMIVQNLLHAYRLKYILNIYELILSFRECWIICNLGGLSGFSPASFVLGDTVRYLELKKRGFQSAKIISTLLIDRIAGVLAIILLAIISALYLVKVGSDTEIINFSSIHLNFNIIIYILIFTCIIIYIIGLVRIKAIKTTSSYLFFKNIFYSLFKSGINLKQMSKIIYVSIVMSLLPSIGVIIFLYLMYDLSVYKIVIPITLVTNFISQIPLTILGIGVREGVISYLFNIFGLHIEKAILLGLILSLSILIGYAPLALIYLYKKLWSYCDGVLLFLKRSGK